MADFNEKDIIETIEMIKVHHLDIRTTTLALSLRDCISEDIKVTGDKVYNKIIKYAKNLKKYADDLENEFSIVVPDEYLTIELLRSIDGLTNLTMELVNSSLEPHRIPNDS